MAGLRRAEGDLDGALDLLDEAERRYVSDFFPNVRPIAALKARYQIARGRIDDALAWARKAQLSADDDLSYLREYEHLTLAMLLIAQFRRKPAGDVIRQAWHLLERLQSAAEAGERTGTLITILIQQALAREAEGSIRDALPPLERALTLAEPERYARTFIDEGPSMARLLAESRERGLMPEYTGRLLGAFGMPASVDERDAIRAGSNPALAEQLTEREREVLHLIGAGLSNREISDRLYLALDTVKGHNRRIFGKLGVQRRTEAMIRARELGLL
jgi:LuxR family maltose regulon positive regulatory protein